MNTTDDNGNIIEQDITVEVDKEMTLQELKQLQQNIIYDLNPDIDNNEYQHQEEHIIGLCAVYVDDCLFTGTDRFINSTMIQDVFKQYPAGSLTKLEDNINLRFLGRNISRVTENNQQIIVLDQIEFGNKLQLIDPQQFKQDLIKYYKTKHHHPSVRSPNPLRKAAGSCLWLLKSRVDAAAACRELSSIAHTLDTPQDDNTVNQVIKKCNKLIKLIQEGRDRGIIIRKLNNMKLIVQCDASYSQGQSCGGYIAYLVEKGSNDINSGMVLDYNAFKIRRVCHSSTSAELLALKQAIVSSILSLKMLTELQIPIDRTIEVQTDSYNLYSESKIPAEKSLRSDFMFIEAMRERIRRNENGGVIVR